MTIIGNVFLTIAALLFMVLLSALYGKVPSRGGDAAMGFSLGIIMLNIAFFVCMLIVTLIIYTKGGFEWVAADKFLRLFFVFGGLIFSCLTAALSALFKYEPGPLPFLLRVFSVSMPIMIPVIVLSVGVILLNAGIKNSLPVTVYKWPLLAVFIFSILGVGTAVFAFSMESSRNQTAKVEQALNSQQENHQRMLREIDSCDVQKDMLFILVFTGDNQEEDVWHNAVAKVKTNPAWQQELIRILDTDFAAESFQFLASNAVDEPALFLEPVRKGVLKQAALIRANIRKSSHPSHFYQDQFTWQVDRVIRTVDRFAGKGTDFLPAMMELRASLDEPSEYKSIQFTCIGKLDNWIKKNH